MKVLVTGGTGFTGSHTAAALAAAGHQVRLLVRDPTKVRPVFEPHGFVPTDLVTGDMTDAAAVDDALAGCDGVVHTAALVDLKRASARLVETSNVRGVELVVGGAARRGVPSIVHVSSLSVFFTPGGSPLSPSLPIAPGTTAYARSKASAERYVRGLQDAGAPVRICYPAGIVGPQDPTPSPVNGGLKSFMRQGWLLTSSGIQLVDVRDLAALHVTLLEMPSQAQRFAATTEMLTWKQFHELCSRITGLRLRHVSVPGAVMRATGSVGDVAQRLRDFDFPLTRDAMQFSTRWPGAETGRTTRELGIEFRAVADTLRDTLVWMYRAGHLTADQVGVLASDA